MQIGLKLMATIPSSATGVLAFLLKLEHIPSLKITMKSLGLLILCLAPAEPFQFMSKWKLPTHDPNAEKVRDKFGDKSEFVGIRICFPYVDVPLCLTF